MTFLSVIKHFKGHRPLFLVLIASILSGEALHTYHSDEPLDSVKTIDSEDPKEGGLGHNRVAGVAVVCASCFLFMLNHAILPWLTNLFMHFRLTLMKMEQT